MIIITDIKIENRVRFLMLYFEYETNTRPVTYFVYIIFVLQDTGIIILYKSQHSLFTCCVIYESIAIIIVLSLI